MKNYKLEPRLIDASSSINLFILSTHFIILKNFKYNHLVLLNYIVIIICFYKYSHNIISNFFAFVKCICYTLFIWIIIILCSPRIKNNSLIQLSFCHVHFYFWVVRCGFNIKINYTSIINNIIIILANIILLNYINIDMYILI